MPHSLKSIQTLLRESIDTTPQASSIYFKTGPGDYAEGEQFLGIRTPTLRRIAKEVNPLPLDLLEQLLQSRFNEERLFALIMLVLEYQEADESEQSIIYDFYLNHTQHVNNWNLVDSSAHHIVGHYLWKRDRELLTELAQSSDLWERRIAIVSTWFFIKQQDYNDTLQLTTELLHDKHDLIHKACGWMLREVGKQDVSVLLEYLDVNSKKMPRTMLRYAIERLTVCQKKTYMR